MFCHSFRVRSFQNKGWRSGKSPCLSPCDPIQILASTPCVGRVCCWFSPLFRRVVFSGSPLSWKTNLSKYLFGQERQMKNHHVNVLPFRNRYLCIYVRYGEMGQFRINLEKVWHDTMNKKRNNYHARTGPAGSPWFQNFMFPRKK